MEGHVFYYDPEMPDKEDGDLEDVDSDGFDKEELEIALYSQIHFETNDNMDTLQQNDITDSFTIDVKGNDKTGFQAELKTADYIINEKLNTEYNTKLDENGSAKETLNENKTDVTKSSNRLSSCKYIKNIIPDKIDIIEKALKAVKNRKNVAKSRNKNYAEKLILDTGSSSENDMRNDSSDFSESDSDDDLIDLDIVTQEGNDRIYVNVDETQQYLMKNTATEDWSIDAGDIPRNNSSFQRSRYYKTINIICRNCDELGHLSKNCPKPKKEQICAFCSETGHTARNCPDAFCYNCEEPGHIKKECTYPKRSLYQKCKRCLMQGHKKIKCPDQWRQYHMTIDGNKLIRAKRRHLKNRTCYNCAADDHLGHECDEERMDRYSRPSNPFICKYLPMEFGYYSREAAEYPTTKVNNTLPNPKREKKLVSQYAISKTHPDSTGRNNFDKLQFSSSVSVKTSEHAKDMFKKPKSKQSRKNVNKSGTDVGKTGDKRKHKGEKNERTKKQKLMENAGKYNNTALPKSGKKRINVKESNKEAKRQNSMEIANSSVAATSKDTVNIHVEINKANSVVEATRSETSAKQGQVVSQNQKSVTKKLPVKRKKKKIKQKNSSQERSSSQPEIQVTFTNTEEDFPRGGTVKPAIPDSHCNEVHVTFTNNLCSTSAAPVSHSERGFCRSKKVVFSDSLDNVKGRADKHQAFHNEWWFNKQSKGKKRNRKNKANKNST